MSEYLIGAGAVLDAGPHASIARATLHAQTDPQLAARVEAAVIDFESPDPAELSRIVIVAAGWTGARFEAEVVRPLVARRECSLADVMIELRRATGAGELHLFARWLPDAALLGQLAVAGVSLVVHPIEAIEQAALVSGQRFSRLPAPFRAA